ncbi:MAG: PaaI family thioesterase [Acidimicrobiaceae bacterium]|nr:PaaI family thioesterase [Acidimicrobiaceae bacterium]
MADRAEALMPFAALIGIETVNASKERVHLRLAWAPERCTTTGILHGGALMAVADTAGALCASLNLPEGAAGTTTIESSTRFLAAVRGGHVDAVAVPLHAGRTLVTVDTELRDHNARLVARTTQTQLVLAAG